jgi:hypothetical protein
MKTPFGPLFALLFLLPMLRAEPPAKPALGMTPAELAAKYGAAGEDVAKELRLVPLSAPAERGLQFRKNGVFVFAQIWQGRAAGISYFRVQRFTGVEVESLLAGNAAGWQAGQDTGQAQKWMADGCTAIFWKEANILSLETDAFRAARKDVLAQDVKGL